MIRSIRTLFVSGLMAVLGSRAQPVDNTAIQNHFQRAQVALAERRYETAAAEFGAILRIDPNRAEVHANLGTVYYAQFRYAEASTSFRKAQKLRPTLKGVEAFLGMSEAREGRWREARPLLEKGFREPLNKEWKLEAGLLLSAAYEQWQESAKLQATISILEQEYPDNAEVLYMAYRVHSSAGARAVAKIVRTAPDSPRLRQIAAEHLEADDDFAGAVSQYRKALELEPRLPGAHRALGVALMNLATDESNRKEARQHFELELTLNPGDAFSEYQLGELMWIGNQPDEALQHFRRAIALQPSFPDALIGAGKALIQSQKFDDAGSMLERAVSLDPSSEVAHYRLAQLFQKTGQRVRAEQELAEFRRLRKAAESLRGVYRQLLENRITVQRVE